MFSSPKVNTTIDTGSFVGTHISLGEGGEGSSIWILVFSFQKIIKFQIMTYYLIRMCNFSCPPWRVSSDTLHLCAVRTVFDFSDIT